MRSAMRRGRIAASDLPRLRALIDRLPVSLEAPDAERAMGAILDLAVGHELTTYDASYLDLALRRGLPLATGDYRLRDACRRMGVPIID